MTTTAHKHASTSRSSGRAGGRAPRSHLHADAASALPPWLGLAARPHLLADHPPGRKTGRRRGERRNGADLRPGHREAAFSAWGPDTEWMRNLRAHPACRSRSDARPTCRSDTSCLRTRPSRWPSRPDKDILTGCASSQRFSARGDLGSDEAVRELVRTRPFVSFCPAEAVLHESATSEKRVTDVRATRPPPPRRTPRKVTLAVIAALGFRWAPRSGRSTRRPGLLRPTRPQRSSRSTERISRS